ncbi:MAG TPA: hypothetical protein VF152_00245 [Acidimicrobiia bacterium]
MRSYWLGALGRLTRRPRLWPTAAVQARRLVPPGWWRRAPFLPLPARDYVRFRLRTQYGAAGTPEPADVVTYLEWCRQMSRTQHRARRARR